MRYVLTDNLETFAREERNSAHEPKAWMVEGFTQSELKAKLSRLKCRVGVLYFLTATCVAMTLLNIVGALYADQDKKNVYGSSAVNTFYGSLFCLVILFDLKTDREKCNKGMQLFTAPAAVSNHPDVSNLNLNII